jgi:hypothetical protein
MNNPTPLHLAEPLAIDEARTASRTLASQRRAAEDNLQAAVEHAAVTEAKYRKSYARAIIAAEGPVTIREAVAKSETAAIAYDRDLASGMVRVCQERLRGLEGERSQIRALMDMSARQFGAGA